MKRRAFVIAGDQAAVVANDIDDFRYLAVAHHVPPGVQLPVLSHRSAETQIMLERGTLEFMVGGASTFLVAPGFARVPPGVPYACRNVSEQTARLLVRAARPNAGFRMIRASIEYAA